MTKILRNHIIHEFAGVCYENSDLYHERHDKRSRWEVSPEVVDKDGGEDSVLRVEETEFGCEETPEFTLGYRIGNLADDVSLRSPEHGNMKGNVREAKPAGEALADRRLVWKSIMCLIPEREC